MTIMEARAAGSSRVGWRRMGSGRLQAGVRVQRHSASVIVNCRMDRGAMIIIACWGTAVARLTDPPSLSRLGGKEDCSGPNKMLTFVISILLACVCERDLQAGTLRKGGS